MRKRLVLRHSILRAALPALALFLALLAGLPARAYEASSAESTGVSMSASDLLKPMSSEQLNSTFNGLSQAFEQKLSTVFANDQKLAAAERVQLEHLTETYAKLEKLGTRGDKMRRLVLVTLLQKSKYYGEKFDKGEMTAEEATSGKTRDLRTLNFLADAFRQAGAEDKFAEFLDRRNEGKATGAENEKFDKLFASVSDSLGSSSDSKSAVDSSLSHEITKSFAQSLGLDTNQVAKLDATVHGEGEASVLASYRESPSASESGSRSPASFDTKAKANSWSDSSGLSELNLALDKTLKNPETLPEPSYYGENPVTPKDSDTFAPATLSLNPGQNVASGVVAGDAPVPAPASLAPTKVATAAAALGQNGAHNGASPSHSPTPTAPHSAGEALAPSTPTQTPPKPSDPTPSSGTKSPAASDGCSGGYCPASSNPRLAKDQAAAKTTPDPPTFSEDFLAGGKGTQEDIKQAEQLALQSKAASPTPPQASFSLDPNPTIRSIHSGLDVDSAKKSVSTTRTSQEPTFLGMNKSGPDKNGIPSFYERLCEILKTDVKRDVNRDHKHAVQDLLMGPTPEVFNPLLGLDANGKPIKKSDWKGYADWLRTRKVALFISWALKGGLSGESCKSIPGTSSQSSCQDPPELRTEVNKNMRKSVIENGLEVALSAQGEGCHIAGSGAGNPTDVIRGLLYDEATNGSKESSSKAAVVQEEASKNGLMKLLACYGPGQVGDAVVVKNYELLSQQVVSDCRGDKCDEHSPQVCKDKSRQLEFYRALLKEACQAKADKIAVTQQSLLQNVNPKLCAEVLNGQQIQRGSAPEATPTPASAHPTAVLQPGPR